NGATAPWSTRATPCTNSSTASPTRIATSACSDDCGDGRANRSSSVEEQVRQQRLRGIHRVPREIGDAGLREHLLVDQEAAGEAGGRAGQYHVRGVGHDLRG